MESLWSDAEAGRAIARYREQGVAEDLALRVYSTRLLGGVPSLVLHGGGNTSVKTRQPDITGEEVEVLRVKGSGWDMAAIEPPGLPAVRLEPLRRLAGLEALGDADMVNALRINLLDSRAPTPSVETLLHAFLPHSYVDHTHSNAVLALTDQPDGEAICRQVYGDRAALVPYVMPGLALAKRAAEAFDENPGSEGLILLKHGVVSFGASAREAYERMIALVGLAEAFDELVGDRFLIGSPEEVAEQIVGLGRRLGVNHQVMSIQWAGMPHALVLDTMRMSLADGFFAGDESARFVQFAFDLLLHFPIVFGDHVGIALKADKLNSRHVTRITKEVGELRETTNFQ